MLLARNNTVGERFPDQLLLGVEKKMFDQFMAFRWWEIYFKNSYDFASVDYWQNKTFCSKAHECTLKDISDIKTLLSVRQRLIGSTQLRFLSK